MERLNEVSDWIQFCDGHWQTYVMYCRILFMMHRVWNNLSLRFSIHHGTWCVFVAVTILLLEIQIIRAVNEVEISCIDWPVTHLKTCRDQILNLWWNCVQVLAVTKFYDAIDTTRRGKLFSLRFVKLLS